MDVPWDKWRYEKPRPALHIVRYDPADPQKLYVWRSLVEIVIRELHRYKLPRCAALIHIEYDDPKHGTLIRDGPLEYYGLRIIFEYPLSTLLSTVVHWINPLTRPPTPEERAEFTKTLRKEVDYEIEWHCTQEDHSYLDYEFEHSLMRFQIMDLPTRKSVVRRYHPERLLVEEEEMETE